MFAAHACDPEEERWERLHHEMIETQIRRRGVDDPRVLQAMREVPRHAFVPPALRERACDDAPLEIGWGQTISQPYIVALMTSVLDPRPDDRVLEVGTGSGYQSAVLARLVAEAYSAEIVPELAEAAAARLASLGIRNVHVRCGTGTDAWVEKAPFDGILVAAAAPRLPRTLLPQLKVGRRLVIPIGGDVQDLFVYERTDGEPIVTKVCAVRFVPLVEDR